MPITISEDSPTIYARRRRPVPLHALERRVQVAALDRKYAPGVIASGSCEREQCISVLETRVSAQAGRHE